MTGKYSADQNRYEQMKYSRCGTSGLKLPPVSMGLWHNFGSVDDFENMRRMIFRSFDLGITHFDLANNYGPVPGSAEENFGRILEDDLKGYRDELIISSKAGWEMWPGPYGNFGSRKYLIASIDQSLKRMGLEYVDIFYHHRPDPETAMEESIGALADIVRNGKALYAGISSYSAEQTAEAAELANEMYLPLIIHQPVYNMFNRWIEDGLTDTLQETGMGSIVFSPLAQGMLTNKYLKGIPADSRAANPHGFLNENQISEEKLSKIKLLHELAEERGQSLAQMAIAWVLRLPQVTSALIGASRVSQIEDCAGALDNLGFSEEELAKIENILAGT